MYQFEHLPPVTAAIKKVIRELSHSRKSRKEGLFVAEGVKVIEELLQSAIQVLYLVVRNDTELSGLNLPERLKVYRANATDYAQLSSLSTPPGLLAVAARPAENKPRISENEWVLGIDRLSDPGNLGTIIRTAEWFGIKTIVCEPGTADCYASKVIQAAMGSLFRMNIHYASLADWLAENEIPGFAAVMDGENCHQLHFPPSGMLIIGSESHGIDKEIIRRCLHRVGIPKSAEAQTESLNAAIACGILLAQIKNPR